MGNDPELGRRATSTFDEAEDALAYGKGKGWTRIIIVTDEFHTRRASYAFEKIFEGSGIGVEVAGLRTRFFQMMTGGSRMGDIQHVLETIKFPVYFFWEREPTVVRND